MASKIRVALIYGGASGEHSVSCLTAAAAMRALDPNKYEVLPVGIRRDGTWVPGVSDPAELEAAGPHGEVGDSSEHILIGIGDRTVYSVAADGSLTTLGEIDVAFPLLHGPFGEDGTIQGMLRWQEFPMLVPAFSLRPPVWTSTS